MSDRPGDPEGTDADTWSAWLPCFDATADTTSDTTGAASPGRGDPTAPVSSSAPVAPTPPGTPLPQSADPTVPPAPVPAQQSYPAPDPAAAPVTVGPAPRSHLALAIVTLLFGFGLPIVSIAAIVAGATVGSLWKRGRHDDARRASRAALLLAVGSIIVNIVWRAVR